MSTGKKIMAEVRPEPIKASKATIWAHAERVAIALKFAPGDAIEPVVARLGGRIHYKNVPPGEAKPESIVVKSSKNFTIFLPTMTSPTRDRFTIAHELGHLFLHYPRIAREHPNDWMVATRWVDEDDPDQQRAEWEANWFAAAFLMPKDAFSQAYKSESLGEVADTFGVGAQAAKIRAKSLGL
jgi:Zn-dependent peptidase ImmA (M78 family)